MKVLLLILLFPITTFAQSNDEDKIKALDSFLKNHTVSSTQIYCRDDIKTPECRMLIRYINNLSGKLTNSFQIAFVAPIRQTGGTEYFLKNEDSKSYSRFTDTSIDGKINPTIEEPLQEIIFCKSSITIKNVKFGTLMTDLSFSESFSELNGTRDGQPVNVKYKRLKQLKNAGGNN